MLQDNNDAIFTVPFHLVNCVAGFRCTLLQVHAYERFGHVDLEGNLDVTGFSPMYVTIGDGGNHELLYDEWNVSMEGISAFRNGQYYGYGTLTIHNATVSNNVLFLPK